MDSNLEQVIAELVVANHILFDEHVVDAFGHVSVRHPGKPGHFLLSRSMAPSRVRAEDIIEHDENGEPVDANERGVYLERFIHAEIYRARPDVASVVHSHSASVIPFGVSRVSLRPVFHMASFLQGATRFEIREGFGDETDLLIRDAEKGRYLAQALGGACVSLLRGHGSVVVGGNLRESVYRAVYTEVNARIQTQAIALGTEVDYLTAAESGAATRANATQTSRCWDLWAEQAAARRKTEI
ncbi:MULTISPECIES: class II aldolase/adducin family protein [Paraburkholderia]|uniref:3-hydroxy-2-methylpyridine-4,5-dicarboxylate 4-decarboxylase n=1 Tax=Paraburkholderia nemoris TaxID=2793076 RepID=A0ABM8T431_9BURK|nr:MULTISPECIES: class II aldolase/adducin family protein [Paraburkholderia]MBK5152660.1 class II aldolase/adducin family protein [Burkholderia sp. R-69608]MBK5184490.1 class II aldolase/adducin family protein [Burkholderia sp. R-69749]MBK3743476.1 class II aldolase/adducin family protein [Paraburkholderia aspalathi]MBK3816101.1 class II aldolase/adducin family protein [Paraburkholderia aspalathi]CAE6811246.1 3-hydroxy-2-methylpyridine-4,5-dicarboxylate 4-decarboxylase [Paraburkholderia nemori